MRMFKVLLLVTALSKLVALAEKEHLFLDLTGLGCYHKADGPAWYDKLSEKGRWDVQARFWEASASRCAKSPVIFWYDLMNEQVVPGGKSKEGDWLGPVFSGKHFIPFITPAQADCPRPTISRQWVKDLVAAVGNHDKSQLEFFQKTAAESNQPVTFEFKRKSGPSGNRKEAFDPKTQTYYLHVYDIARFEVKAVAGDLDKRPVVLKITGMLDKPEGPLTLFVPEEGGKHKGFKLFHQGFDKGLFRIDRKDGVTTIEFLPKGRQLLRPGAWFQYIDFFRN